MADEPAPPAALSREAPSREAPSREAPSREERLAAKLRENLRRRKAQARALDSRGQDDAQMPESLSKPRPKS